MGAKSPMIIGLREIPPGGLRLELALSDEWTRTALEGTPIEEIPSPLQATIDLTRTNEQVYLKGTIRGEVVVACSRCTAPARLPVDTRFSMVFLPEEDVEEAAGEEVEMSADDADVGTYREDVLELEETYREQLLLALPYAPLCREDCRGLCQRCGKDLNEGPCGCPEPLEPGRDKWAALKNVKL